MKIRAILTLVTAFVMMFSLAAPVLAQDAEEPKPLGVGDEAQNFTLQDPEGKDVSLKDIMGKADKTALIFMNTACSACMMEAQVVDSMAKASDGKLAAYAILVDSRGAEAAMAYQKSQKFKALSFLLDSDFTVPPVYGFSYTPAMIMVDKSGKIVMSKGGFSRKRVEEFKGEVEKHL